MRKNAFAKSVAAATLLSLTGCASSTLIRTNPSGARLYLDGSYVGKTPYTMMDTKPSGSSTVVRMEKLGYQTVQTVITRNEELDVAACIGGLFLLVPFFWILQYQSEHVYTLEPDKGGPPMPSEQL